MEKKVSSFPQNCLFYQVVFCNCTPIWPFKINDFPLQEFDSPVKLHSRSFDLPYADDPKAFALYTPVTQLDSTT